MRKQQPLWIISIRKERYTMSMHSFILKRIINNKPNNAGTSSGIIRYDNILYGRNRKWNLLDLYVPDDRPRPLPIIVNIHGGAWVTGKKEQSEFYCLDMARRGFAVVNFTYRLAPRWKHPAPMEDCNNVVLWLLEHAKEYDLDTNSVFLIGDSAGAHNAAMYACMITSPKYAKKFDIKLAEFRPSAICLNCGVYDIQLELNNDPKKMMKNLMGDFLGRGYGEDEVQNASPIYHITSSFPRTFLMSATGDFLLRQVEPFDRRLTELGVEHITKVYGDETNKLDHVFHCLDVNAEPAILANDEQADFLRKYIK